MKVGGKMFACAGTLGGGVSGKTTEIETAQMQLDAGIRCQSPVYSSPLGFPLP